MLQDGLTAALVQPIAIDTWDALLSLPGVVQRSNQETINFNEAVRIVGIYPSIALNEAQGGYAMPTLDDIELRIQHSSTNGRIYTQTKVDATRTNGRNEYASLGAFRSVVTGSPRVVAWDLDESSPQLSLTVGWRRSVTPGQFAPDVLIGLSFFVIRKADFARLGLK